MRATRLTHPGAVRAALLVSLLWAGRAAGEPLLSCTPYVPVSKVNVGQVFTVTAKLGNTGDTDINFAGPCPSWIMTPPVPDCIWLTSHGGGAAVEVGSPWPQPQVTSYLVPGQTTLYEWTFVATSPGTVDFTVSALGREVGGPGFPKAVGTATIQVQKPALLSATVTTSSQGLVRYGDTVTVYMEVSNWGDASSDATVRFSITLGGTGRLTPLPCPSLATLCPDDPARRQAVIEHNSATLFTWIYRADAPGTVTILVSAGGLDHNAGSLVVSNTASTTFGIPEASVLSYTITGAEGVVQGEVATFKVAVANLGTTLVCQSSFDVVLEGAGAVRPATTLEIRDLGDSLLPICYEPGQVRSFALRFTVPAGLAPGVSTLSIVPVGVEAWTGVPALASGASRPLLVVEGKSGLCGFSANPWRPRLGPATVCYAVAPGDSDRLVTVAVYTLAGELVRTLDRRTLQTGVYRAVWDGRNESGRMLASGVYLVLFQSYLGKDTRKLAVLQ